MIELKVILLLVWFHFLADFVFQSRDIANNKSKDNLVLFKHCVLYGLPFLLFGVLYAVINMVLHFVVDYVTSRVSSMFWEKKKIDKFFLTIGLDQTIHFTCLFVTYKYLNDYNLI